MKSAADNEVSNYNERDEYGAFEPEVQVGDGDASECATPKKKSKKKTNNKSQSSNVGKKRGRRGKPKVPKDTFKKQVKINMMKSVFDQNVKQRVARKNINLESELNVLLGPGSSER